jgi:N-acetylglucosaminyldiphosphoundecaprenol N-acetyl-beta-D-mannosaminyltransferase
MDASLPSTPVLGVDCFVGDLETATEAVVARASSRHGGYACLANVHVVVSANRNPTLQLALDSAWAVFPDGAPIAWLQRRTGGRGTRIAGPDLMPAVLDSSRSRGLRHFLFGSTPEVIERLDSRLRSRFQGVEVVGRLSPPIGREDGRETIDAIAAARPDIVWVALGAPKQELWSARHAAALSPALLVGVGAAFDFHGGSKRRAPLWIQRAGLEWLHRLAQEPTRLGWRYVSTNAQFCLAVLRGISSPNHPETESDPQEGLRPNAGAPR